MLDDGGWRTVDGICKANGLAERGNGRQRVLRGVTKRDTGRLKAQGRLLDVPTSMVMDRWT
jgi:hypothetical protein